MLTAGPAAVILPLGIGIDTERRPAIVVEGAKADVDFAGGAQTDVTADDIDNVVGFFDLLCECCPVVRQGPPAGPKHGKLPRIVILGTLVASLLLTASAPATGKEGIGQGFHGRETNHRAWTIRALPRGLRDPRTASLPCAFRLAR